MIFASEACFWSLCIMVLASLEFLAISAFWYPDATLYEFWSEQLILLPYFWLILSFQSTLVMRVIGWFLYRQIGREPLSSESTNEGGWFMTALFPSNLPFTAIIGESEALSFRSESSISSKSSLILAISVWVQCCSRDFESMLFLYDLLSSYSKACCASKQSPWLVSLNYQVPILWKPLFSVELRGFLPV